MSELKYSVVFTNRFKKDYKTMLKRGQEIQLLDEVITALAKGEILDKKYRDHYLTGDLKGFRECHIKPDWLLIYKIENEKLILTLTRTGSHSDMFE